MFGIVDEAGIRIFREFLIVIGRKNRKNTVCIPGYRLLLIPWRRVWSKGVLCSPEAGSGWFSVSIVLADHSKRTGITSTNKKTGKSDFYVESTNSSVKKIAFNAKKSDGFNPHLTVCDEVASWPGDQGLKQYEVMKSALGARKAANHSFNQHIGVYQWGNLWWAGKKSNQVPAWRFKRKAAWRHFYTWLTMWKNGTTSTNWENRTKLRCVGISGLSDRRNCNRRRKLK